MEINLKGSIPDQMAARLTAIEKPVEKEKSIDDLFTIPYLEKMLALNYYGDALILIDLNGKKFMHDKSTGEWMVWCGCHYSYDVNDSVRSAALEIATVYTDGAKKISQEIKNLPKDSPEVERLNGLRKAFNDRAFSVRNPTRIHNILVFAADMLAVTSEKIDTWPYLLPCGNVVVDLKTGLGEPGRQEDLLVLATPIHFPDDGLSSIAPVWEKTLLDCLGSQEIVDCFQRVVGMALIGSVVQAVFVILYGRGRNGKTLVMETINKVLGDLSAAVNPNMYVDQKTNLNPGAPSPHILSTKGRRIINASESGDGAKLSGVAIKGFGGDTKVCRGTYSKKEIRFLQSATPFFLTNFLPRCDGGDYALFERIIVFPWPNSFVPRQPAAENEKWADPHLSEKLEKELPSILAWMVRGCLQYQEMGLAIPPSIKAAVSDYQKDSDILNDFFEQKCVIGPDLSVGAKQIYTAFESWWVESVSKTPPSNRRFGELLSRRFKKKKARSIVYFGIGLAADIHLFQ